MTGKRLWLMVAAVVALVGALVVALLIWTPGVVLAWLGGIVAAALVAYLSQDGPRQIARALARRRERRERIAGVPVTYTARIRSQDYVVLADGEVTAEVPASGHTLQIVVAGVASAPVVLTDLRVEVLSRSERSGDLARHAAEIPARQFEALLDQDPPRIRPLTASDFPYRVTHDESEVFNVLVSTDAGDVRWVLWLDWSTEGRTGSLRIDLGGQAFRTAARHGLLA